MIAQLRIKGRDRINTLYFVPLPLSCRQALGVSAGTVHIHTINIPGSGCQAQEAAQELSRGGDSDNPIPTVPPLSLCFQGRTCLCTALLELSSHGGIRVSVPSLTQLLLLCPTSVPEVQFWPRASWAFWDGCNCSAWQAVC